MPDSYLYHDAGRYQVRLHSYIKDPKDASQALPLSYIPTCLRIASGLISHSVFISSTLIIYLLRHYFLLHQKSPSRSTDVCSTFWFTAKCGSRPHYGVVPTFCFQRHDLSSNLSGGEIYAENDDFFNVLNVEVPVQQMPAGYHRPPIRCVSTIVKI